MIDSYLSDNGLGVERDIDKAMFWYNKAALAGESAAMTNLALSYKELGDFENATVWLKKVIEHNDDDAVLEMGKLLLQEAEQYLKIAVDSTNITEDAKEEAEGLLNRLKNE